MADIKISQEMQAVIQQLGPGRVQINMIQVNRTGDQVDAELIWKWLCSMHDNNRMETFEDFIIDVVDKYLSNDQARGAFLGIAGATFKAMRRRKENRTKKYYAQFERKHGNGQQKQLLEEKCSE